MFKNTVVELGSIVAGSRNKVVFKAEPGTTNVEIAPPDCSCTSPEWDEASKEIRVSYIPKAIPAHLVKAGNNHYNSTKTIIVNYILDGKLTHQELSIKAKVTNR